MKMTQLMKQSRLKFFFSSSSFLLLPFLCFPLLKETETQTFWCGYSLYIRHSSLFEKPSLEIPSGGTEKTEAEQKERQESLRWYPNKSKRPKGAFIVKLTVGLSKVGDDVTTWWREIGQRRHSKHTCGFAGVHVCAEEEHTQTHTHTQQYSSFSIYCRHTWKKTAAEKRVSCFCNP